MSAMALRRRDAKIQVFPVGPPPVFLSGTEALSILSPTFAPVTRFVSQEDNPNSERCALVGWLCSSLCQSEVPAPQDSLSLHAVSRSEFARSDLWLGCDRARRLAAPTRSPHHQLK